MKTQNLSIDLLRIDGGTQSRLGINEDRVADYQELIENANGEWPLPPLIVFHDGTDYLVADGFHRKLAALRAKRGSIPCEVHKGTAFDAKVFGMTANDKHGLPPTRADKRANVVWLLEHPRNFRQSQIAEMAGVHVSTVKRIVAERNVATLRGKGTSPDQEYKGSLNPCTPSSGGNGEIPENQSDSEPETDENTPPLCEQKSNTPPTDDAKNAPPIKALEGREAEAFDARRSIDGIHKTIGQWFVRIDQIRNSFPSPVGDKILEHLKAAYESMKKWEKVVK